MDRFSASLRATAADLTTAQNIERAVRQAETPSLAEARDAIFRLGELLWTHRPEHSGFLTVRLGLGTAQSRCRIEMPTRNDTEPRYWGQLVDLQTTFSVIADVPIVGDLRSSGALGICGPRGLVDGVARGVLLQLVGLHSPAELSVAAFASPASRGSWEWLEWLPHCGSVYSPLTGATSPTPTPRRSRCSRRSRVSCRSASPTSVNSSARPGAPCRCRRTGDPTSRSPPRGSLPSSCSSRTTPPSTAPG